MGMILMPGGGGGIDLDVVTAAAGDILSGKVIVGADGEPLTGTLALSGDAAVGNVLTGKTFYAADAKTKLTGTMPNRGALNWSGNNTTKAVDAGYYSGGTLDSRPSYNSGRTQGQNDVKGSPNSYGLYTKTQYDANWNNGVNHGRNTTISGITYATVSGTSGGATTVDTNTVTVPSGKSKAYVCVGLYNPQDANTYAVLNGVRQAWNENFYKNDSAYRFAILNVSGGENIYVHSQRQNTSHGTQITGVVIFV